MRAAAPLTLVVLAAIGAAPALRASADQVSAESREVRQLVTFRALPGQLSAILDLYRSQLMPIYRDIEPMQHVRAFGEVESPEPLDLLIVTHYADMAAMDRANRDLRRPVVDRTPVGQLYAQISNLTLGHHDQFVEVFSAPNFAPTPDGTLEVFEFLRVNPGLVDAFERQLLNVVHPWEQENAMKEVVLRSESARFLVGDGWDVLRTYAVRDLAAWQAYATARGRHPAVASAQRMVSARKTLILREIPELRVR